MQIEFKDIPIGTKFSMECFNGDWIKTSADGLKPVRGGFESSMSNINTVRMMRGEHPVRTYVKPDALPQQANERYFIVFYSFLKGGIYMSASISFSVRGEFVNKEAVLDAIRRDEKTNQCWITNIMRLTKEEYEEYIRV
jgi:hypothetical protein